MTNEIPCPVVPCLYVFPDRASLSIHLSVDHPLYTHTEVRSTSAKGGQKGVKLERFDLIPAGPLAELARHYGVGAIKYAEHQWRQGYEWSKSIAAIGRHWSAFAGGEDYDCCPPSGEGCSFTTHDGKNFPAGQNEHGLTCYNHTGSHHMCGVAWHSFLLLEFKDTHPDMDDRWKVQNGVQR